MPETKPLAPAEHGIIPACTHHCLGLGRTPGLVVPHVGSPGFGSSGFPHTTKEFSFLIKSSSRNCAPLNFNWWIPCPNFWDRSVWSIIQKSGEKIQGFPTIAINVPIANNRRFTHLFISTSKNTLFNEKKKKSEWRNRSYFIKSCIPRYPQCHLLQWSFRKRLNRSLYPCSKKAGLQFLTLIQRLPSSSLSFWRRKQASLPSERCRAAPQASSSTVIASPGSSGPSLLGAEAHTYLHLSLQDIRQKSSILSVPPCDTGQGSRLLDLTPLGTCSKGEADTESISACFCGVTSQTRTESSVSPHQFRTIPTSPNIQAQNRKSRSLWNSELTNTIAACLFTSSLTSLPDSYMCAWCCSTWDGNSDFCFLFYPLASPFCFYISERCCFNDLLGFPEPFVVSPPILFLP